MSLNDVRRVRARLGAGAVCVLIASGALIDVLAQTGPLGIPRPSTPGAPPPGRFHRLAARQAGRILSRHVRRHPRRENRQHRALALFGLAFAYGIFHAAGPGHGKAVISSYLVANEETWRRGIILSFASAFLQALVAVLIVGIAAALLGATAKAMGEAVRYIEIISYALIAVARRATALGQGQGIHRGAARRGPPVTITAMRMLIHIITRMIIAARPSRPRHRTVPAMFTTRIAGIRTGRSPTSSPVPAAGSAA